MAPSQAVRPVSATNTTAWGQGSTAAASEPPRRGRLSTVKTTTVMHVAPGAATRQSSVGDSEGDGGGDVTVRQPEWARAPGTRAARPVPPTATESPQSRSYRVGLMGARMCL